MHINDQAVIDYIKNNGQLVDFSEWSDYSGTYLDYGLHQHMKSCNLIAGEPEIIENKREEFLGTFEDPGSVMTMEVRGFECDCGEYEYGEIGYYLKTTFSEMLLNILAETGVNVDVNVKQRRG